MAYDQDDYELLPHQELERLREENAHLRKNPFKDRAEPKDLQGSVDKLTESINKLIHLLSDTNHEMMQEFKTSSLQENFKMISSQNEKIAEGILTVAQLIQAPSSQYPPQEDSQNNTFSQQQSNLDSQEAHPQNTIPQTTASQENNSQLPNSLHQDFQENNTQQEPINPDLGNKINTSSQQRMYPNTDQQGEIPMSQSYQQEMSPPPPPQDNSGMQLPPPPKKKGFGLFK